MISVINGFNKLSFGSTKPKKTETINNSTTSQDGTIVKEFSDPSKELLVKKTTIIPQKCFALRRAGNRNYPTVEDAILKHKYIENRSSWFKQYAKFSEKCNPGTLNILDKHISSINISNERVPFGTIAIPSRLDECLTTDGLYQCAGVALIDKKHNLQTLIHVCPMVLNMTNKSLLDYILSFSKPEDLEIYIAPGEMEETDKTIEFIVNTIKENNENYNINFVNFPDNKNTTLVLENGELACTKYENNHITETNPKNRIIYA